MLDTTETLNTIQYNVNKSRNRVMTPMFKSLDPERHHILAVQEPWRNPQMPTTSRPPKLRPGLPPEQRDASMLLCQQSDQSERVGDYGTLTGPRNTRDLSRRQDTAHLQLLQPSTKASHQP